MAISMYVLNNVNDNVEVDVEAKEVTIEDDKKSVDNNVNNNTFVVIEDEEISSEDDKNNVSENINDNDNVIKITQKVIEDMNEDAGNIIEEIFVVQKTPRKSKKVFEKVVSIVKPKKKGKRSIVNKKKFVIERKNKIYGNNKSSMFIEKNMKTKEESGCEQEAKC